MSLKAVHHILTAQMKLLFPEVALSKPSSSRANSLESFIVCRGYSPPPGLRPRHLMSLLQGSAIVPAEERATALMRVVVPFVASGDLNGWRPSDADADADAEGGAAVYRSPIERIAV